MRAYRFLDKGSVDLEGVAVAYVDTTGSSRGDEDAGIDLSHWYPNRTASEYRGDTSTEIALRFAAKNPDHEYLPVNDHCDTDGVLSVFALAHPELAADHFDVLVAAAEIGDFSFWGSDGGRRLYAGLSEVRHQQSDSPQAHFAACVDFVARSLAHNLPLSPAAAEVVATLERSKALLDATARSQLSERFVTYVVDNPAQLPAALTTPRFDEYPRSPWLSHRVRNCDDNERLQLLSVAGDESWFHSLWYPQYMPWDTETLWRMPGLEFTGHNLTWRCAEPGLLRAFSELAGRDLSAAWSMADKMAPFAPDFPVLIAGRHSQLEPEVVAGVLADAMQTWA